MAKRPTAIHIGRQNIGDYLQRKITDWDFLPTQNSIAEFYDALRNQSITNEIHAIFIIDSEFDPTGVDTEFETFVSTMGEYCFVGILNYRSEYRAQMRDRIETAAYSNGVQGESRYYFIEKEKSLQSIQQSLQSFIKEAPAGNEAVRAFLGYDSRPEPVHNEPVVTQPVEEPQKQENNPYLGQVVAVTSSKGGSGKSTVAVSLATYLAHASENSYKEGLAPRPLKVAILDLDIRDGQLGFLTGTTKPTVLTIRSEEVSKESIEKTAIHSSRLKCDLFLAPKRPRASDDTPPAFYAELIQMLKTMYDYIILDTSVNYLDPLLESVAYPIADQIVFVTDMAVNSIFSMSRWIREVTNPTTNKGMGISSKKIAVVVNKALTEVNMPGQKIKQAALQLPIITAIPNNPKLVTHAANANSMEMLLKHQDMEPAIRRIALSIVGKTKYPLSKTAFSK